MNVSHYPDGNQYIIETASDDDCYRGHGWMPTTISYSSEEDVKREVERLRALNAKAAGTQPRYKYRVRRFTLEVTDL